MTFVCAKLFIDFFFLSSEISQTAPFFCHYGPSLIQVFPLRFLWGHFWAHCCSHHRECFSKPWIFIFMLTTVIMYVPMPKGSDLTIQTITALLILENGCLLTFWAMKAKQMSFPLMGSWSLVPLEQSVVKTVPWFCFETRPSNKCCHAFFSCSV